MAYWSDGKPCERALMSTAASLNSAVLRSLSLTLPDMGLHCKIGSMSTPRCCRAASYTTGSLQL